MKTLPKAATATLLAAVLGGCISTPPQQGMHAGGMHAGGMHRQAAMGPGSAGIDTHMRQMQEMHGRMMAAKTPEERHALRAEHHKAMHGGMAAMHEHMGAMQGSGHCTPEMMQRHRNMMHMMMQMMEETPADPRAEKK